MATFLDCAPEPVAQAGTQRQLTFTRFQEPWIYCNYPERLPSDGSALGDRDRGNRCLNRVLVDGPAQVYASYWSRMAYPVNFGIQLYNPGSTAVTVTLENNAHRHSGQYPDWCDVECGAWADFFANNPGTKITMGPGKAVWIFTRQVPANKYFNSLVRFETSGPVWCFAYVYVKLTRIDGTASLYPWDPASGQYRGRGDGYFQVANLSLKASDLPTYWLSHACGWASPGEMIPIQEPSTGQVYRCENGANLGNWGAQYLYRVAVTNDTATPKALDFYVGAGGSHTEAFAVVVYQGRVKYCCGQIGQWWHFLTDALDPGATVTYEYQHIQASNSLNPASMQIKVRPA